MQNKRNLVLLQGFFIAKIFLRLMMTSDDFLVQL